MKFKDENEVVIMSNLLSEVKDRSLQSIFRRVVFSGEDIKDVLMDERPEMTEQDIEKLKLVL